MITVAIKPKLAKVLDRPVDILLGGQFGDEGKGKVTDEFAADYDICVRPQGGPNAGHTLWIDGKKCVLSQHPCGAFHEHVKLVIGCESAVNPLKFVSEVHELESVGINVRTRTFLSHVSPIITPYHQLIDRAEEHAREVAGDEKIGTTGQGISVVYGDVAGRRQLLMGDLFRNDWEDIVDKKRKTWHWELRKYIQSSDFSVKDLKIDSHFSNLQEWLDSHFEEWKEAVKELRTDYKSQVINVPYFMYDSMRDKKRVLAEMAQASGLDMTHGELPFVTSSHPIAGGATTGMGVSPRAIGNIVLITKAYSTRVGSGSHPSEFAGPVADKIASVGKEVGAVSGRPRRIGWLDMVLLKWSIILNGPTHVYMAKGDCLDGLPQVGIVKRYKGYPNDLHHVDTFRGKIGIPEMTLGWNNTHSVTDCSKLPSGYMDFCNEVNRNLHEIQPGLKINFAGTGGGRGECVVME